MAGEVRCARLQARCTRSRNRPGCQERTALLVDARTMSVAAPTAQTAGVGLRPHPTRQAPSAAIQRCVTTPRQHLAPALAQPPAAGCSNPLSAHSYKGAGSSFPEPRQSWSCVSGPPGTPQPPRTAPGVSARRNRLTTAVAGRPSGLHGALLRPTTYRPCTQPGAARGVELRPVQVQQTCPEGAQPPCRAPWRAP